MAESWNHVCVTLCFCSLITAVSLLFPYISLNPLAISLPLSLEFFPSALRNMKHTLGFDVYLSSAFQVQSNICEISWQNGRLYIGMH